MGAIAITGNATQVGTTDAKAAEYDISNPIVSDDGVTIWDCVYFGNYYQNNSEEKEPIKWRVLSVDGDDAFVIADEILDAQPYDSVSQRSDVAWSDSSLRQWLNSFFLNTAFSEIERDAILETEVENTKDNIFLLSFNDVSNTEYGFSLDRDDWSSWWCDKNDTLTAVATEYAKNNY